MKRIDAIKKIMKNLTDELVITSPGMISREVYQVKDRAENFYVMGSMGAPLGIGIGVALNTDKDVKIITGDGDILMDVGAIILMNKIGLKNLHVYILDNNSYATTGGQQTCSDAIDFAQLCPDHITVYKVEKEKGDVPRIGLTHEEIKRRFMNALKK